MPEKKPKKIIRVNNPCNQIVRARPNPHNRYKLRTTKPAPGGVGVLRILLGQ